MSSNGVRQGVTQAKTNEQGALIIAADAAALACVAWAMTGQWAVGLVVFVVVGIAINIISRNKQLSTIFSLIGGLVWGFAVLKLLAAFDASQSNCIIAAVVAGLISAGWHMMGFQHFADAAPTADSSSG